LRKRKVEVIWPIGRGHAPWALPYPLTYLDGKRVSNHQMKDCRTFLRLQGVLELDQGTHQGGRNTSQGYQVQCNARHLEPKVYISAMIQPVLKSKKEQKSKSAHHVGHLDPGDAYYNRIQNAPRNIFPLCHYRHALPYIAIQQLSHQGHMMSPCISPRTSQISMFGLSISSSSSSKCYTHKNVLIIYV
jgi:hypothetical protein